MGEDERIRDIFRMYGSLFPDGHVFESHLRRSVEARPKVLDSQSFQFADMLRKLLERSGNNPVVIQAVQGFLKALDDKISEGNNKVQLGTEDLKNIAVLFNTFTQELKKL